MQHAVEEPIPPLDAAEQCAEAALAECDRLTGRLATFSRLFDAAIAALPSEKRLIYEQKAVYFRVFQRPRAVSLDENVVQVFNKNKRELVVSEVHAGLVGLGITVHQKQVYNALDYLTRKGRLKRKSPGRYYCPVNGVGVEGDPEGGYE